MTGQHDLLLDWVSEKGSGTWTEFREAHDWLFRDALKATYGDPAYRTIIGMSTLGQLEIDWGAGRWAAAPTILTVLPHGGANSLLAGSRTRALFHLLRSLTDEEVTQDYVLNVYEEETGPSAIFIAAPDEVAVSRLAEGLGVGYEYSISDRLSRLLPGLHDYLLSSHAGDAPRSLEAEAWSSDSFVWRAVTALTRPGLYRFKVYGRHRYRWVSPSGEAHDVDYTWGTYAELRARGMRVLRYQPDGATGTLSVPLQFPLPILHGRAAALCSGLTPRVVRRPSASVVEFRNVTKKVCVRIAESLEQGPIDGLDARDVKISVDA
jgi:hypothetical protein